MFKKKTVFYSIILLFFLLIVFITQKLSFNYISNFFYHENFYKLIKYYIPKVNHIRGLDYRICNNFEKPDCFIFTEINAKKGKQNTILINGDSWAESFVVLDSKKKILTNFAIKNDYKIILSGTSSYSFSPMTSQLDVLKKDWNIKPDYVISIFDQTDIGDELCRYRDHRTKTDNGGIVVSSFDINQVNDPYNYVHFLKRNKIFFSDNSDLIKILKITYLKIKHEMIKKKTKVKCNYSNIQNYLINGLTVDEEMYMVNVINDYINNVFNAKNLKKLIIVTHPHKQHLKNIYKYDIATLITKTIKNSLHKNKIHTLNFKDDKILKYNDFIKDDISSHLKPPSLEKYANHILSFFKLNI